MDRRVSVVLRVSRGSSFRGPGSFSWFLFGCVFVIGFVVFYNGLDKGFPHGFYVEIVAAAHHFVGLRTALNLS